MDGATIICVTVFTILFVICFLIPMLSLLIKTGIEIKENKKEMDINRKEIRRIIERM